jgi:hypothetical protein
MANEGGDQPRLPARTGPSVAEILEFARRSKLVNLETTVATLLEHLSIVEPKATGFPGAEATSSWGIVNQGYGIVTSSS